MDTIVSNLKGQGIDTKKQGDVRICSLYTGRAIYDFISRSEMYETDIGNIRKPGKLDKQALIVIGYQRYSTCTTPSAILKAGTDIRVNMRPKLSDAFTLTAMQLMAYYMETAKIDKAIQSEIRNKMLRFWQNKNVINSLKLNKKYTLIHDTSDNKECELVSSLWKVDETGEINQELIFKKVINGQPKTIIMDITDYMTTFFDSDHEIILKNSKVIKDTIKMSRYGLIHPVSFIDEEKRKISADCTYIYYTENGTTKILGYWDGYKIIPVGSVQDNIKSTKLYKTFEANSGLIAKHKDLIAPYLTFEENIIEV